MKLFTTVLLLAGAITLHALESVPGLRGKGAKINGDFAYLYDRQAKPFDFKKGVTVCKIPEDQIINRLIKEINEL